LSNAVECLETTDTIFENCFVFIQK
jgi:hypothetical protein